MKIKKSSFFLGTIFGIVLSSIIVYAGVTLFASDVEYKTDANKNVENVADAIDDLYNNYINYEVTHQTNAYHGIRAANKSTSLTLAKGKYIIVGHENYLSPNTSAGTSQYYHTEADKISLEVTNGQCSSLNKYIGMAAATTTIASNTYIRFIDFDYIWKCEINDESNLTIKDTNISDSHTDYPMSIILDAIKIGE